MVAGPVAAPLREDVWGCSAAALRLVGGYGYPQELKQSVEVRALILSLTSSAICLFAPLA